MKALQWQIAAFLLSQVVIVNHAMIDAALAQVWQLCRASSWFKHDTWEPGLVVLVWPLFTAFWYVSASSRQRICVVHIRVSAAAHIHFHAQVSVLNHRGSERLMYML